MRSSIIIVIAFIIIVLIHFTIEFINNRKKFKTKDIGGNKIMEYKFFEKYHSHKVKSNYEYPLNYTPLEEQENLEINNNIKFFIINSYLGLIHSIIGNNNYLINHNVLFYRNLPLEIKEEQLVKKNKKNKKKIEEITIETSKDHVWQSLEIKKIDWLKILKIQGFKEIKLLRVIDYYFFQEDENHLGIKIQQEFLLNNNKKIIDNTLIIHTKTLLLTKVNDEIILDPKEEYNSFFNVKIDEINGVILATILSVFAVIETKDKNNLLFFKNINTKLYNDLINFYNSIGSIEKIENINIHNIIDNIYRCHMIFELNLKEKKIKNINKKSSKKIVKNQEELSQDNPTQLLENNDLTVNNNEFIREISWDFEVPEYAFIELINLNNPENI